MNWFYAEAGQQRGPISEEEFQRLVQAGGITPATLVWRDGMANWQPLAAVQPTSAPPPGSSPPPFVAPASLDTPPGHVICSECRKAVPAAETVQIGQAQVCAACKPLYLQKLREGSATFATAPLSALRYAGFWIRFAAKLIDGIIVGVPVMAIYAAGVFLFGLGSLTQPSNTPPNMASMMATLGLQAAIQLASFILGGCYTVFFVTKYGATPGKMVVKLQIVMADGSKLTFGRAVGRYFAEIVSGLACYIGYIIAGFDDEKRSLHDRMCDTRVVFK